MEKKDEILVRLSIGDLVGHRHTLTNLPWTANKDPLEDIPDTRSQIDPDPVPRFNSVTVYTFLGRMRQDETFTISNLYI